MTAWQGFAGLMHFSAADIADAVHAGLHARARADDVEQAVYSLDSLDELALHPIIRAALSDAGYGALPERRYPGAWNRRRKSEGQRCDLVLTPEHRPLRDPELAGTLFATALDAVDADQACWLEIKTVAQYESAGPFKRYASELLAPVTADVGKLERDEVIRHAALLLVLFTASQEIAEHDLAAWHERCLTRGHLISPPAARMFALTDRIGNACCATAVFKIRG
ncbi:MAG: hypothetical protein WD009_10825 [Phycisphaeraceae bacterium]